MENFRVFIDNENNSWFQVFVKNNWASVNKINVVYQKDEDLVLENSKNIGKIVLDDMRNSLIKEWGWVI